jgi:uroporphyrinogen-III synthase
LGVALAQELTRQLRHSRVFLPRSDRANRDLPATLKQLGVDVTEVIAYRTLPPSDVDIDRANKTIGLEADAAVFFSPSAVHNLVDLVGKGAFVELQDKIAIAAVGPVTASALHEYEIRRIVIAADTTAAAVVESLELHFAETGGAQRPFAGAKYR